MDENMVIYLITVMSVFGGFMYYICKPSDSLFKRQNPTDVNQ